jgi:AhpD family alkylhydroperoxidase
MELESRIEALIAVGASVSANCQPCLQSTIAMALEPGANEQEIAEAIQVGQRVRKGAASKMDRFVSRLNLDAASPASVMDAECECGRL